MRLSVVDGIATKHPNTRSELASAQRDHVLSDVGSNLLSVLEGSMLQDPLDKIVPVLIARD